MNPLEKSTESLTSDRLISLEEMAVRLGVTKRTVYRLMAESPDLPKPVRIGKRWRFRESDFLQVLQHGATI